MPKIGVTKLLTAFLGQTEDYIDSNNILGVPLYKVYHENLRLSMRSVTYAASNTQAFLLVFDDDFDDTVVCQKTNWGNQTLQLYDMIKEKAIPYKKYIGSDGFFIYLDNLGYLLVEMQYLENTPLISVSRECIL